MSGADSCLAKLSTCCAVDHKMTLFNRGVTVCVFLLNGLVQDAPFGMRLSRFGMLSIHVFYSHGKEILCSVLPKKFWQCANCCQLTVAY